MLRRGGRAKSASVLVITLWVLSFLSVFAVNLAYSTRGQLSYARHIQNRLKAYYLAKAGIEKATSELINDDNAKSDTLIDTWANDRKLFWESPLGEGTFTVSYQLPVKRESERNWQVTFYGAMDESGKININKVSANVLSTLLECIGEVSSDEADDIASAIIDWRDVDLIVSPGGAENTYYQDLDIPYECKDGKLELTEELLLVRGVTPEIFQKINKVITVYGSGKVNINTAGYATFYALGLSESLCRQIMEFRKGGDGKFGTEDDETFSSVQAIRDVAPLFTEDSIRINKLIAENVLGIESNVFRISSSGQIKSSSNTYSRNIVCVLERFKQKAPQILYWHEN